MPPMKIYETLQQSQADAVGGQPPAGADVNFFSQEDTGSKKDGASMHATSQ